MYHPPCLPRQSPKSTKGLTLLELVIALSVWMILSVGIFLLWQHTTNSAVNMLDRQNALENARSTMDALIRNMQISDQIVLYTDRNNVLDNLRWNRIRGVEQHEVEFTFYVNARRGESAFQVMRIGGNEFSSNIRRIYITYTPNQRMNITVQTACDDPIILHGSVDVRYKCVTVNRVN